MLTDEGKKSAVRHGQGIGHMRVSLVTLDQLGSGDGHASDLNSFHDLVATNLTVNVGRAHLSSVSACSRDD